MNKFNPLCPEKGCKHVMVIKEFTQYAGISDITGKKKKKWGLSKYWVCPVHKHQRFKVGAEVILRKSIPIEPKKELTTQGEVAKPKSQRRRFLIPRKIRRKIIREQSKQKEEQ